MTNKEEEIKMAWLHGKDKRERGANIVNCSFDNFSTPQKKTAWEFGEQGKPFSLAKILKSSL